MSPRSQPVSGPARRLGASLLTLARIRLELLAIEVQEEKDRIASLMLWAVLTALLAGFGAIFLALFVTVALWDTHRLLALGVCAAAFIGFALLGWQRVQGLIQAPSTLFHASIGELRHDSDALRAPAGTDSVPPS